jgi:hypothetical protein
MMVFTPDFQETVQVKPFLVRRCSDDQSLSTGRKQDARDSKPGPTARRAVHPTGCLKQNRENLVALQNASVIHEGRGFKPGCGGEKPEFPSGAKRLLELIHGGRVVFLGALSDLGLLGVQSARWTKGCDTQPAEPAAHHQKNPPPTHCQPNESLPAGISGTSWEAESAAAAGADARVTVPGRGVIGVTPAMCSFDVETLSLVEVCVDRGCWRAATL